MAAMRAVRIEFPNDSRSFDTAKKRVRFWGYDTAIEITFFIDAPALAQLAPGTPDSEEGYLGAFDRARDRIRSAAARCYSRRETGSYACFLSEEDF